MLSLPVGQAVAPILSSHLRMIRILYTAHSDVSGACGPACQAVCHSVLSSQVLSTTVKVLSDAHSDLYVIRCSDNFVG